MCSGAHSPSCFRRKHSSSFERMLVGGDSNEGECRDIARTCLLWAALPPPPVAHFQTFVSFARILTNPPFVADFVAPAQGSGALYAGSGIHGLNAVQEIVSDCSEYLELRQSANLLMVTELPNVEQSCELLQSFLPSANHRISVAYIVDDVETVQEYAKERAEERGDGANQQQHRLRWEADMQARGITNRALVLAAIQPYESQSLKLFAYERQSCNDVTDSNPADEEDQFLTPGGVSFARNALLSWTGPTWHSLGATVGAPDGFVHHASLAARIGAG